MSITIYIGNLPYAADKQEIHNLFNRFGPVQSVKMVTDPRSGRFRGFGFIEMDRDDGTTAIETLNGQEYSGRDLRVNEAKSQRGGGGGGNRRRPPRNKRYHNRND